MGRELKRVAKDFSWPLSKVWEGFLNPFYKYAKTCPFCDGSGVNPETKVIKDSWYNTEWHHNITQEDVQALVDEGRLMDFTHIWSREGGWVKKKPMYIPNAKEVNEWSRKGFGHDSINHWVCYKAKAKRLGVYGECDKCKGSGEIWLNEEYKEKADKWEKCEPPSGEYYQLWETVSEGSPISPAFETPEKLAEWLSAHPWNGCDKGTTYDQWLNFITNVGYAPSGVMHNGIIESGVKAAAVLNSH